MLHSSLPDTTLTPVYTAGSQTLWQTGSVAVSRLDHLLAAAPRCGTVVICAAYRPGWTWRRGQPEVAIVPLVDTLRGVGRDHLHLLDEAWRSVDRGWRRGHDVVVACEVGVYRSAGVILCWLTRARGFAFADALKLLQDTRGVVIGRDYHAIFAPESCPADGFFGHVRAVAAGLTLPADAAERGECKGGFAPFAFP